MGKSKGILYFIVASKRAVVAAVSLCALRKVYDGPVHIATSTFSDWHKIAHQIVADKRLNLTCSDVPIVQVRRHAVHTSKTWLHRYTPFDSTLFLDADTIPVGDFDEVWPVGDEMVLTQFSNWYSCGQRIKNRIHWWDGVRPDLVKPAIDGAYAAVNTGVLGFTRNTVMLEPWHQLTVEGAKTFIPDEIAAQLIYFKYEHRLLDDRFNCSPQFGANKNDARIWHCHGGKHLHPTTAPLWTHTLQECWRKNIGHIQSWMTQQERERYAKCIS